MKCPLFLSENTVVDGSYCSKLWVEAEGDGDHQAQHKRNADVMEGSNQQRVPLEKSSPLEGDDKQSDLTALNPTDGGIRKETDADRRSKKCRKCVKMTRRRIKNSCVRDGSFSSTSQITTAKRKQIKDATLPHPGRGMSAIDKNSIQQSIKSH